MQAHALSLMMKYIGIHYYKASRTKYELNYLPSCSDNLGNVSIFINFFFISRSRDEEQVELPERNVTDWFRAMVHKPWHMTQMWFANKFQLDMGFFQTGKSFSTVLAACWQRPFSLSIGLLSLYPLQWL